MRTVRPHISFEHEAFRPIGELLLEAFQKQRPWKFEFSVASEKLSQMQHYRRACKEVWEDEFSRVSDTWVLFSDDDDRWSKNRFSVYMSSIRALVGQAHYTV